MTDRSTGPKFITRGQFLSEMGISMRTYRKYRAAGKMPPEVRLSQRTVLFSTEEVDRWKMSFGSSQGGQLALAPSSPRPSTQEVCA
jgi:predicted DNA-binding transcriptional regulator AlpA